MTITAIAPLVRMNPALPLAVMGSFSATTEDSKDNSYTLLLSTMVYVIAVMEVTSGRLFQARPVQKFARALAAIGGKTF